MSYKRLSRVHKAHHFIKLNNLYSLNFDKSLEIKTNGYIK